MIEYFVDTLEMSLHEDSFYGYLHPLIFRFSMDEMKKDEDEIEVNRQIMRFLAKAAGKGGLDQMEKVQGNTALHAVCD